MNREQPLLAQIKRAEAIESQHYGFWLSWSEAELKGNLHFADEKVCLRSVAKLFQTLTCLQLGMSLTDELIAIATSSHSGTETHVVQVNALLEAFELNWQDLQCGEHPPIDKATSYSQILKNRRLQNNCSGKHGLMLATCRLKGWSPQDYLSPQHPLQESILQTIARMSELTKDKISLALDGCGLPTFSMPAKNLLKAFSKFTIHSTNSSIAAIARSLLNHSLLVSGHQRLDHELTKMYYPYLISKSGAGGLSIVSFQTKQPKAILLKIHDSDEKIRGIILNKLIERELSAVQFAGQNNTLLFQQATAATHPFLEQINNLHGQAAASIQVFV